GGGTCSHSDCSQGTKLVSSCDPCVTKICGSDPYCCGTQWDGQCVKEVGTICGQTCGGGGTGGAGGSGGAGGTGGAGAGGSGGAGAGGSGGTGGTGGAGGSGGGGTCSHTECSQGTKLVSGCDACATTIC